MHLYLKDLLSADEIRRLMEISESANFVDGRMSNTGTSIKNNLQAEPSDPGYLEAGEIVSQALYRHPRIRDFCHPKSLATPMMCKYEPGMHYGIHVDAAVLNTQPPVRSDVSCTVFLADPATYEGGELSVQWGDHTVEFKGRPGEAVLYPSTSLHQVKPVISGQRIVSIMFMQSHIRDPMKRDILFKLANFMNREHQKLDETSRMELEYVRQNLLRMWSET